MRAASPQVVIIALNTALGLMELARLWNGRGLGGVLLALMGLAAGLAFAWTLKRLPVRPAWRIGLTLLVYMVLTLALLPFMAFGPFKALFTLGLQLLNLAFNAAVIALVWPGWPKSWKRRVAAARMAARQFSRPVMGGAPLRS